MCFVAHWCEIWSHPDSKMWTKIRFFVFYPDIIKSFIYPTECTTRLKFTLKFVHKNAPTFFS